MQRRREGATKQVYCQRLVIHGPCSAYLEVQQGEGERRGDGGEEGVEHTEEARSSQRLRWFEGLNLFSTVIRTKVVVQGLVALKLIEPAATGSTLARNTGPLKSLCEYHETYPSLPASPYIRVSACVLAVDSAGYIPISPSAKDACGRSFVDDPT